MFKKAVSVCLMIVTIFTMLYMQANAAPADYTEYDSAAVMKILSNTTLNNLKAKGAVLTDFNTGTVLIEKNCHDRLPIASVTKIMSMLLTMEAIETGRIALDTKVTVSDHASNTLGTSVWLETGEVFTVKELLKAVAIRSANDATVALGEAIAGSEEAFVAMMNERAAELDMNNTHFLDCTGLTDVGHYSSAYDVALMSRELLQKYPQITDYTRKWQDKFRENVPGKDYIALDNTNKLVRFYDGTTGLKTGFTEIAGHCLSASAVRNGQQFISVVLGEPDSNTRFAESRKLLDYAFANFETTLVNKKGESVGNVQVKKGVLPVTNAVFKEDVKLLLKKGEKEKIDRVVNIKSELDAPIKDGEKIGEMKYMISGNVVGNADLVSAIEVKKASFLRVFISMVKEWFRIGRGRV